MGSNNGLGAFETINEYKDADDLTKLEEITLNNVVECLVARYRMGLTYTFAGSVLISLNPCKELPQLFSSSDFLESKDDEGISHPHVYNIGQKCLKNLATVGNKQIIVVSGDSGSGKTTATQQLIRYFTEKQSCNFSPSTLERKIYFSTQVLECLGNASTIANSNSSRFGRLVQLNYTKGDCRIIGAQIRTCLLEKYRVSKCSANERSFHIFYYIIAGLKSEYIRLNDLIGDNIVKNISWELLVPSHFIQQIRNTDQLEFRSLFRSLKSLQLFSELKIAFSIIFGIMVLLNIEFEALQDEDEDDDDNALSTQFTVTEESTERLQVLSAILKVDTHKLEEMLVFRKISAGRIGARQSIFYKPCATLEECKERQASFACSLYESVFHHVLNCLNKMFETNSSRFQEPLTSTPLTVKNGHCASQKQNKTLALALLDLYGFETNMVNGLEQLSINYANERLQLIHIMKMKSYQDQMLEVEMELETDDFRRASIKSTREPIMLVNVEDELLKRIEQIQTAVFSVLNEECLLNRGNSTDEVHARISVSTKSSTFVETIRSLGQEERNNQFIIRHYAGKVKYSLDSMLLKNSDYIPPEFSETLACSSHPFVKKLSSINGLSTSGTPTHTPTRVKVGKTVLQRFKVSVDELIHELKSDDNQDVHFIRCIRPNQNLTENHIESEVVKQQLFSCGIVDIIRVAGNGFPIRISKTKFCTEFQAYLQKQHTSEDCLEDISPDSFGLNSTELRIGTNFVFMTERAWNILKKLNDGVLYMCASTIQKTWRQFTQQRQQLQEEKQRKENQQKLQIKKSLNLSLSGHSVGPYGDVANSSSESSGFLDNSTSFSFTSGFGCLFMIRQKTYEDVSPLLEQRAWVEKEKLFFACQEKHRSSRIVSRSQIYEGPIKFYTKETSIRHAHGLPKRLKSKGLIDALDFTIYDHQNC